MAILSFLTIIFFITDSGKCFKGSFARYPPDAFKAGSILRIQEVKLKKMII